MTSITPEMARQELARRELAKRQNTMQEPMQQESTLPEEGFLQKLPRNIAIGLTNAGKNLHNAPHDLVQMLEGRGEEFKNALNFMPKSPLKNPISSYLPNDTRDYAETFGQKGYPTLMDEILQKGIEHAPEIAGGVSLLRNLPLTARGIMRRMSGHKQGALNTARNDYSNLFSEAAEQGVTHVRPPRTALANRQRITSNSQRKYHQSLNEYLEDPTLENAHWAQSDLGALERHLNSIADKTGLTSSQQRALRAAEATRNDIRNQMFSENALGANPALGERYTTLSNQYRENVVPYTRLKQLSETEAGRMLPKTAVQELLNNDQFMIELARRYPGLILHTPKVKSLGRRGLGLGATLAGYEGAKKLFK